MSKKIKKDTAEKAGLVCGAILLACIAVLAIAGTIKAIMLLYGL